MSECVTEGERETHRQKETKRNRKERESKYSLASELWKSPSVKLPLIAEPRGAAHK